MDFSIDKTVEDLRGRVQRFVAEELLPLEDDPASFDEHDNIRLDLLEGVRARARDSGLWAPQLPRERGGLGLSMVGRSVFYEAANQSIFGPAAFNCAAPDDGNMSVLEKVASPAQKDRWLQPIADGRVRSAFVMTEPHPGAVSDPGMMLSRAEKGG